MTGIDQFMVQVEQFIEAWSLFSTAVWSSVLAGILLGLLGSYLVLRKMVFLNAAITQASTLGIVLAFVIHQIIPPLLLAPVVTMLCVWWVDQNDPKLNRENRIAVVFVICNALAIVLHSMTTQEPNEIERLLMGSAVLVQEDDYLQLLWSTLIIGIWQFWWWRGFAKVSFDPVSAQIQGLPFQVLNFILLLQIASNRMGHKFRHTSDWLIAYICAEHSSSIDCQTNRKKFDQHFDHLCSGWRIKWWAWLFGSIFL
jgi:zinc transport system permease protein